MNREINQPTRAQQSPVATMNLRSTALAARLEAGATALAAFADALTDREWQTRLPQDGRKIGVVSATPSR